MPRVSAKSPMKKGLWIMPLRWAAKVTTNAPATNRISMTAPTEVLQARSLNAAERAKAAVDHFTASAILKEATGEKNAARAGVLTKSCANKTPLKNTPMHKAKSDIVLSRLMGSRVRNMSLSKQAAKQPPKAAIDPLNTVSEMLTIQ